MVPLAVRCPRLGRARDQYVAEQAAKALARHRLRERWAHVSWLVAHRDLQLHRAFAKGDGPYIDRRQRKLDQARRELATVEAALEQAA